MCQNTHYWGEQKRSPSLLDDVKPEVFGTMRPYHIWYLRTYARPHWQVIESGMEMGNEMKQNETVV